MIDVEKKIPKKKRKATYRLWLVNWIVRGLAVYLHTGGWDARGIDREREREIPPISVYRYTIGGRR